MLGEHRIRGRVGTGEDGKFYFEISLWNLAGTEMVGGEPIGTVGPFDSNEKAHEAMGLAVKHICEQPQKGQETPTGYLDFNDKGKFKPLSTLEKPSE